MRKLVLTAVAMAGLVMGAPVLRADDKPADDKGPFTGILIDNHCGAKQMEKDDPEAAAAKHDKTCALKESCSKEGYSIISGKKQIKLDEAGNKLAKEYLAKADSTTKVKVEGKQSDDGSTISVSSIKPADDAKADDKKDAGKKEDMSGDMHEDK